jgi:hypothetical protein
MYKASDDPSDGFNALHATVHIKAESQLLSLLPISKAKVVS